MSFFDAALLGIVEGITEFLPISSTAHLMMASKVLAIDPTEFLKSFEIVIQFGAIAAVLFMFGPKLLRSVGVWQKIIIAFLPTAVVGFLIYGFIKEYLIGNLAVAAWSLAIGGLVLIAVELFLSKRMATEAQTSIETISNKKAFIIGLVQSIAVIPGVSRSAATIIAARLLGASRVTATEFSFLLALPTLGAAASYDLIKNIHVIDGHATVLLVGFVASFIASALSIKLFLGFIKSHSFSPFGVYRIIVALLFIVIFL